MRDGLAGKTTSITAAALGVDVCKSAKRLAARCASRARPRGDRARPGWPLASRWPTTPGRQSSAPIDPGGEVLLPGEIEQKTMAARTSDGIDIDETTWSQIVETAESVGLSRESCGALVVA